MDILQSLLKIYNNGFINKKIKVFENLKDNSLYNKLIDLLSENEKITDSEVIQKLYGGKKTNTKSFLKLKERLQNKLINTLLLVDSSEKGFTERYQSYIQLNKEFLIGRLLANFGYPNESKSLIDKVFKQCLKLEFLDLQLIIAKYQTSLYGNIHQDNNKFTYYNNLLIAAIIGLTVEADLRNNVDYLQKIRFAAVKKEELKLNKLREFEQKAIDAIRDYTNIQIKETAFNLLLNCYFLEGNKTEFLRIADESIDYFTSKNKLGVPSLRKNVLDLIIGCFSLRLFDLSDQLFDDYSKLFTIPSHNWFAARYYIILGYIHRNKYPEAKQLLQACLDSSYFSIQSESMQQHIKVLAAYITYVFSESSETKKAMNNFRIKKFLNEVPLFNKEKRGMNISILIIHVAFLIYQQKYDEASDRIEALKLYSYRYLKNNELLRSTCFIKLLVELAKCNYNKKWAASRFKSIYEVLVSTSIEKYPHTVENEIIPYEDMWEIILARLV